MQPPLPPPPPPPLGFLEAFPAPCLNLLVGILGSCQAPRGFPELGQFLLCQAQPVLESLNRLLEDAGSRDDLLQAAVPVEEDREMGSRGPQQEPTKEGLPPALQDAQSHREGQSSKKGRRACHGKARWGTSPRRTSFAFSSFASPRQEVPDGALQPSWEKSKEPLPLCPLRLGTRLAQATIAETTTNLGLPQNVLGFCSDGAKHALLLFDREIIRTLDSDALQNGTLGTKGGLKSPSQALPGHTPHWMKGPKWYLQDMPYPVETCCMKQEKAHQVLQRRTLRPAREQHWVGGRSSFFPSPSPDRVGSLYLASASWTRITHFS